MAQNSQLYRIIEYILNRSTEDEIEVIQKALERRLTDIRQGTSRLRIDEMARKMGQEIKDKFNYSGEVQSMIRRLLRETIKENQPDIPEKDLEEILNRSLPGAEMEKKGKESQLPADVVMSMIVQFVDYSLGRMDAGQKSELKRGWHEVYWNTFSPNTKRLIQELLNGEINEETFWEEIKDTGEEV